MPNNKNLINKIVKKYKQNHTINVAKPTMPNLEEYNEYLKDIWHSSWLTNDGKFHKEFEQKLSEYLKIKYINAFSNGTIALMVALQALRINSGEVVTTPFTFAATPHVLYWNKVKPVFCDINEDDFCINPEKIVELITPDTKAIMPVHVYGIPCDVKKIKKIADIHGLHVIYDAAHAFGVKIGNKSILEFGDISALSFHATKLFSTIEGGALVSHTKELKNRINHLKNFGIIDEETIVGPGINGKMNELQAAFGIMQLDMVKKEIENRKIITFKYRNLLKNIDGIKFLNEKKNVTHNYAYFPVTIEKEKYGLDRDELNIILRKCNIIPRKYFYPLCSDYPCYKNYSSSKKEKLKIANKISNNILCLPLYGTLQLEEVEIICNIISEIKKL